MSVTADTIRAQPPPGGDRRAVTDQERRIAMATTANKHTRRRARGAIQLVTAACACGVVATVANGHAEAVRTARLAAPVIREQFTPLPCPKHAQSTLELEGCAELRIVRTDRQIDRVVGALFSTLPDDSARGRLATAQRAWLAYRRADCASMSDKYQRGTFAGVAAAYCTGDRSVQRLKDLRRFETLLRKP
jgi:uncharacterized protein YecT (DUF1311 family)